MVQIHTTAQALVYHALKEAGLLPASYWIGNTDTLFDALERMVSSTV